MGEGERSTRYFFELVKKQGENKMWNRIKNTEGKYKYDIDSIIDEQLRDGMIILIINI